MKMIQKLALPLVGGLTLLVACGSVQPQSATLPQPLVVEVVGNEWSFTPGDVAAQVGQPVVITFKNEGQLDHDWAITTIAVKDDHAADGGVAHADGSADAHGSDQQHGSADTHGHAGDMPALHVAARSGTTGEVHFTPTAAGDYEIVCTIPGHTEAGMHGRLTVTN